MVKRCVVLQPKDGVGWSRVMREGIVDGLRKNGVDVTLMAPDDQCWKEYCQKLTGPQVINIINLQVTTFDFSELINEKAVGLNVVYWTLDTPGQLIGWGILGLSRKAVVGFVDRSYLEIAKLGNIGEKRIFLPHAGSQPNMSPKKMHERHINFLFAGSIGEVPSVSSIRQLIGNVPEPLLIVILRAAQILSSRKITAVLAWEMSLLKSAVDFDLERDPPFFMIVLDVIERAAEAYRRRDVLLSIAKRYQIDVISKKLPDYLEGHPNIKFHGYRDFSEILAWMGDTKILLNSVAKFSQGSHERIAYGMSQGAVLAADESDYLKEFFDHDQNIAVLPWGDRIEDYNYLFDLVEDDERLQRMQQAAMPIYQAEHTYLKRMQQLEKYLVESDDFDNSQIIRKS